MAINDKSIFVGDTVRLSGKTRHSRNRIRENGDMWEVITIDGKDSSVLSTKICVVPIWQKVAERIGIGSTLTEDEHMDIEIIDNEVVL